MSDPDVLIAGAGPTGLALALWLTRLGAKVRIVDKNNGPSATSRALGVQPRTLELYDQLGMGAEVAAAGQKVPGFNMWTGGAHRARIPISETLTDETPSPYLLVYPQNEHEHLLVAKLAAAGVTVDRRTELVAFEQDDAGVTAALRRADGGEERCSAAFIAGCDGAHSTVRETLGIGFPGGDYDRFFYVADIEADGPAINGEIHVNFDAAADFLAIFPLAASGRARLVGTLLDDHPDRRKTLTFDDVSGNAIEKLGIEVRSVEWFSTYRVHHRVADRFRERRAFLLGDAGHIHSPAGGQGMNTGIGDAINLAWKLASALRGQGGDALLDTYQAERMAFAQRLVATTDRVFTLATSDDAFTAFFRRSVAPWLFPLVNGVPAARRFNFRTIGQLALNYRRSALSEGQAGAVHGGDRLPWVAAGGGNFAPLRSLAWQVHVYGAPKPNLRDWCAKTGVALQEFEWSPQAEAAGLARDAAYLVRPDAYVALAEPSGSLEPVRRYCENHGVAGA